MINLAKPTIEKEEKDAVLRVLESGILAQGKNVKELEEKFAEYCGTKYAVAVNSGTAAIHSALYALGVSKNDEVITTPFTFVATANPIIMQNAKIVFADIDMEDFNINPDEVEKKITDKTKAIIAVDLYGHPCNYQKLKEISEKYNVPIIEDCCQAHGAEYNGIKAGNLGDIGCFSLYATKNIMCGEGGIITTNDEKYAELCKRFRHHGQSEQTRYLYEDIGYNYRLTDLQAAIAIEQLKKIEEFTNKRIENARILNGGLKNIKGITLPTIGNNIRHVFHQHTIICDNENIKRDELLGYLKENGINAGVYYPKPLHLHPHFMKMGYNEGDFPVSEKASLKVLSLPVHPNVSKNDLEKIIDTIKNFIKQNE